jgi:NADH-quinone oxidoreductase subunit J
VSPLLFLLLAALTLVSAVTVIAHPNPVHSACALVATLFLLAVFFVGLDAQLIAFLQIIVYAGAVVVLFLFVIMLLNLQREERATAGLAPVALAGLGGGALVLLLLRGLQGARTPPGADVGAGFGETAAVAQKLFTTYLLPFELTSILLLVAIVGAVAIAQKRRP